MLAPTHLFFSLAIAYILRLPRIPCAIGGVIADLDVLLQAGFPLVHRGIVHTPLILVISVVLLYLALGRQQAFGFGAGFGSHLLLDVITPSGILLLYPLSAYFTLNLVPYNNTFANLGIIGISSLAIAASANPRLLGELRCRLRLPRRDFHPGDMRLPILAIFLAATLGLSYLSAQLSAASVYDPFEGFYAREFSSIPDLLNEMPVGKQVAVRGTVSQSLEDYVSSSGRVFSQFILSDGASQILVFCSTDDGLLAAKPGQQVLVEGEFMLYQETPEIYTKCSRI